MRRLLESQSRWGRGKKASVAAALVVFTLILMLAAGEIAIRIYHSYKYRHAHTSVSSIRLDRDLGWGPNPDFHFVGERPDAAGRIYYADVSPGVYGFRYYGDPEVEGKKKILLIGDSYSHAVEVSLDKTYYYILADTFDMELFALGVGGYSNLQEYLIMDMYIDEIDPDIVLLQFCANDFVNNCFKLERESTRNNNGLRRPYLTSGGDIIYAIPKKFSFVRDVIIRYSRFLYFVMSRLDMIRASTDHSIEDDIDERGREIELFDESIKITEDLIVMIRSRIPRDIPLYVFCVDCFGPCLDEIAAILDRHGIPFIPGVSDAIIEAETAGEVLRANDRYHWNHEGHRIAADVLIRYYQDSELIEKR